MKTAGSLLLASLWTAVVLSSGVAADKPFLHPVFSDDMVLQRDMEVPVWGWTEPGKTVTVKLADKEAKAVADAQGKWMAKVPALPAGGPYTLTVVAGRTVTLTNVLMGDVWICSGQSNMEWPLGAASNAAAEIAEANYPLIRHLTVRKFIGYEPQELIATNSRWEVCASNVAGHFTAVGYFFGRDLHRELKVPIGLINSSWGGTVAEAWTSDQALRPMKDFDEGLNKLADAAAEQRGGESGFAKAMDAWYHKVDPGSADGKGWERADVDDTEWKTMVLPQAWERAVLPDAGQKEDDLLGDSLAEEGSKEEASLATFDGIVWFRKTIDLPEGWKGKDAMLHLGPVDDRDTTWFNGTLVGGREDRNAPRDYKVPASAVKAGPNVIAVRVLDTTGPGGLVGRADQMVLELADGASGERLAASGNWKYRIGTPLARAGGMPQRMMGNPNMPSVLYNGMIAPLLPYGVKGAIWYQGESNAGRAQQYRTLLPTMITDWRARFGVGDFPFYIVQLANFMQVQPVPTNSAWAELRWAQYLTTKAVPPCGVALAIDIGDAADIHPRNKQEVGRRLALNALATTYGKKIEYSGPVMTSVEAKDSALRVSFDHCEGGLSVKGEKLTGFAVAGDDKAFVWADAAADGNVVTVSAATVAKPVWVRYAWADNPICNLYNTTGLPAVPFEGQAGK